MLFNFTLFYDIAIDVKCPQFQILYFHLSLTKNAVIKGDILCNDRDLYFQFALI